MLHCTSEFPERITPFRSRDVPASRSAQLGRPRRVGEHHTVAADDDREPVVAEPARAQLLGR